MRNSMPDPARPGAYSRPIIIIGCGGHAAVLIDALKAGGAQLLAAADDDPAKTGTRIAGLDIIGDRTAVRAHDPGGVLLANGVGSKGDPRERRSIFHWFKQAGYEFATVVHPSAVMAGDVVLGEGVQIMAGAVIQPRCTIGANTIVNTRAGIDHDARIGEHVHIGPGATLCGDVTLGNACHVGPGATLIQGVRLAGDCVVAAGAVVVRSFDRSATLYGMPAKPRGN